MALETQVFEVTWFDPETMRLNGRPDAFASAHVTAFDVAGALKAAGRVATDRGFLKRILVSDVRLIATIDPASEGR